MGVGGDFDYCGPRLLGELLLFARPTLLAHDSAAPSRLLVFGVAHTLRTRLGRAPQSG